MKNAEIRSWRNTEDGPRRRSNQNVQIVSKRTQNITSLGRILRAVNYDSHTNVRKMTNRKIRSSLRQKIDEYKNMNQQDVKGTDKPKDQTINMLNKSTNCNSRIIQTLEVSKRHISYHKPINTQKPYNLRKDVYVRRSRINFAKSYTNECKIRTTYAKPLTLRKVVQKRTQNPCNLRKAA